MAVSSSMKAAGAALVAGLAVLLYQGLQVDPGGTPFHVRITLDGGVPAGTPGLWVEATGKPEAQVLFGLTPDAGPHTLVHLCTQPADGGADSALPPGMFPFSDAEREDVCDAGSPQFEAWVGPDAPWECACTVGHDCTVTNPEDGGEMELPVGTYAGGDRAYQGWHGAGCVPKPCHVWGGAADDSWPAECPLNADGGAP